MAEGSLVGLVGCARTLPPATAGRISTEVGVTGVRARLDRQRTVERSRFQTFAAREMSL